MSRHTAREDVYKLTFEYLFSKLKNDTTLEVLLFDSTLSNEDKKYINEVYNGVINNFDELLSMIEKYAEGYAVDRIYKPDLAAMLLCTYELKYVSDVPPAVAISEAVELVKKYSTEKSNSFVNGILSSIYKELYGEM